MDDLDGDTGTIVKLATAQDRTGIYEVNGRRYVYALDFQGHFVFCCGRIDPANDIHAAWRLGYKEELARAARKGL
jgi:hypothetical protein